jgi:hypothetical protein
MTCAEITPGTAITVGVDPRQVEQNIALHAVTTTTTQCDAATGEIGTLVVTPSGDSGAVTVVVGYARNPIDCVPPLFEGCIVARRRFTFIESRPLQIPIVIDPDCKNVPCDALSTCSRGVCFDAEVDCAGGECEKPGEQLDGAPDDDAAVVPDAPQPARDGAPDAPTDGPVPEGGPDAGDAPYCMGTTLMCRPYSSGAPTTPPYQVCTECCDRAGQAGRCGGGPPCYTGGYVRYCCLDGDCGLGRTCLADPEAPGSGPPPPGTVGRCSAPVATCDGTNTLRCPAENPMPACSSIGGACCLQLNVAPTPAPVCRTNPGTCGGMQARKCCTSSDCSTDGGGTCIGAGGPNMVAGTCQ